MSASPETGRGMRIVPQPMACFGSSPASNRPQVKLHQEQAVRAARLASPFKLPREYYDAWKLLSPIGFDKRLSQ